MRLAVTIRSFILLYAFAVLLLPLPLEAAQRKAPVATPEEAFIAGREAFRTGNRDKLMLAAEQLRGHPLEMYGEYWLLLLRRSEIDDADFQSFLARNDKSFLAERARVERLRLLGNRRAWEQFDTERAKLVYTEDIEVLCYSALARVLRKEEAGRREAMALWMTPRELPPGCIAMAEQLLTGSRLLDRHVWERIRALADANQLGAIKRTAEYLPDDQALDLRQLESAFNQPGPWLKRGIDLRTRPQRELALLAVGRLAKTDPRDAAEWWKKIGKKPFTESEHQWAWAQIAIQAARRLMPEADEWFAEASEIELSDEYLQWMARAPACARATGSL